MNELPEIVIKSNGCHYCVFSHETNGYLYFCSLDMDLAIDENIWKNTRNHKCPLNTHSVKVMKSDK